MSGSFQKEPPLLGAQAGERQKPGVTTVWAERGSCYCNGLGWSVPKQRSDRGWRPDTCPEV